MIHFIILAAGKSRRFSKKNNIPKQLYSVNGVNPIEHLLRSVSNNKKIDSITIVINKDYKKNLFRLKKKYNKLTSIISGGSTRQESSLLALKHIKRKRKTYSRDIVLIHDAARPFLDNKIINKCISGLDKFDCVFPIIKIDDTIRKKGDLELFNRDQLIGIQTPQAFILNKILDAHKKTKSNFTDDVSIAREFGLSTKTIPGQKLNFKITSNSDIEIYKKLIEQFYETRIGNGFDFHKFKNGSSLKIGGYKFKSKYSLEANSDGDPVLHSITDAILGCLGENDIGFHFEPNNRLYKNINSVIFINKALELMYKKQGQILNLDINIICDYPKINPIRAKIRKKISNILNLSEDKINIKASTTEEEGFINAINGIACQTAISLKVFQYD